MGIAACFVSGYERDAAFGIAEDDMRAGVGAILKSAALNDDFAAGYGGGGRDVFDARFEVARQVDRLQCATNLDAWPAPALARRTDLRSNRRP